MAARQTRDDRASSIRRFLKVKKLFWNSDQQSTVVWARRAQVWNPFQGEPQEIDGTSEQTWYDGVPLLIQVDRMYYFL